MFFLYTFLYIGILRGKTIADKLTYIPNDDTQNYPFCKLQLVVENLNTHLIEPTNQHSIKVLEVVKPTNTRKT